MAGDPLVSVAAIDHIVLNVADGRRAMEWYRDRLGLEPVRLEEWEAGEASFVSLRVSDTTIIVAILGGLAIPLAVLLFFVLKKAQDEIEALKQAISDKDQQTLDLIQSASVQPP